MSESKFYVERFTGNGIHTHELPGAAHVGVLLGNGDAIELTQPYSTDDYAQVRTRHGILVLMPQAANVVSVAAEGGGEWASKILQGPEDAENALYYALQGCNSLERMAAALARNASTVVTREDRQVRANEIRLYVRQIREALK